MKTVNLSLSTCRVPDNDGIIGLQVIRMMNLPKRSTNFCHFSYRAYVYCFIIALQNVRCVTDWICLHSYSAVLIFLGKKARYPGIKEHRSSLGQKATVQTTSLYVIRDAAWARKYNQCSMLTVVYFFT